MKAISSLLLFLLLGTISLAQSTSSNEKTIYNGALSELNTWLENGGNADARYKDTGYNLLCIATKNNKEEWVKLLINKGADIELQTNYKTPLMYAAKYGRLEIARLLLSAGAIKTKKSAKGKTAYDYAIRYKKTELATLLKD